jgi:hypothetical protein
VIEAKEQALVEKLVSHAAIEALAEACRATPNGARIGRAPDGSCPGLRP